MPAYDNLRDANLENTQALRALSTEGADVTFVNRLQDAFLRTVATNANALQDRLLAVSIRFRLYVWLVA